MKRPVITLLTDFGLQDSYVGQMKGAIAAINPEAIIIDLTHAIPPQQVWQAAVTLCDAVEAFPPGTIHLVVVDPGVGSTRRAVAAEIGQYRFVFPDNGLLSPILGRHPIRRAVELNQPRWWRPTVTGTFHGRDLFAPVAAAWSLGHDLTEFGSPLGEPLAELSLPDCSVNLGADGATTEIRGQVLTIDHFGNLITNIPRMVIPAQSAQMTIQISKSELSGIVRCYADGREGDCIALFGSSDRLEIAVVNGHAAQFLDASVGQAVEIRYR
jgi:S-adenosylmethionine hydrolase